MPKYETHFPQKSGADYDRCFSSQHDANLNVYYKPLVQSILAMMQFDMGGKIDLVSKRFCQCFNCHESTKRALDGIFTRSEGMKVDVQRLVSTSMEEGTNTLSPNNSPPFSPKSVANQNGWSSVVAFDTKSPNNISVITGGQGQTMDIFSNPLQVSPPASPNCWMLQKAHCRSIMNPAAIPFTPASTSLAVYRAGGEVKNGSLGLWPAVAAHMRPTTSPPTVDPPRNLEGLVAISVGAYDLKISIEKQWVKSLPYFYKAMSTGQVVPFPDERVDVVVCFLEYVITGNYTCHINYGMAPSITKGSAFAEALFHLAVARLAEHVGCTKLTGDAISKALDLQGRMGSALRLRFWSVLYRRGYKMICATVVQATSVTAWMSDLETHYRNHLYAAKAAIPRLVTDMQVINTIARAGGIG